MSPITLISDADPTADEFLFAELLGLSHLLIDVGHRVRLWVRQSAQSSIPARRGLEILSPCPEWKMHEVLKALPYFVRENVEILHVLPKNDNASPLHAFSLLFPLIKNLHQIFLVSHFLSWPQKPSVGLRQLLNLSDLVLTPSENLRQRVSSDPSSTLRQRFACFPLLMSSNRSSDFSIPSHLQDIDPFIYVPGAWHEWQNPGYSLDRLLQWTQDWPGLIVVDPGWNQNLPQMSELQKIIKKDVHRVVYLERISHDLQFWLLENAEFIYASGLMANSITTLRLYELYNRGPLPLLFSSATAHHLNFPDLWNFNHLAQQGPLVENPQIRIDMMAALQNTLNQQRNKKIRMDPANELNRLYSQSLIR